jgi:hypothetical protein
MLDTHTPSGGAGMPDGGLLFGKSSLQPYTGYWNEQLLVSDMRHIL